jgi:hypothetical protein
MPEACGGAKPLVADDVWPVAPKVNDAFEGAGADVLAPKEKAGVEAGGTGSFFSVAGVEKAKGRDAVDGPALGVLPNVKAGVDAAGSFFSEAAGVLPNEKDGCEAFGSSFFALLEPPNEKPGVDDAASSFFSEAAGVLPNEKDGCEAFGSSFFALLEPPNEKPGVDDAASSFFSEAAGVLPNEKDGCEAFGSSFFTILAPPNVKPWVDDAAESFFSDAVEVLTNVKDGCEDFGSSFFALLALPNENPPLAEVWVLSSDADGLPPNVEPRELGGFAVDCSFASSFFSSDFDEEPPNVNPAGGLFGAAPKLNPPLPIDAEGVDEEVDAVEPPNENPPLPIPALLPPPASPSRPRLDFGAEFSLVLSPPPSPLGVSQQGHLSISFGFFVEHVLHFHSPGLAANIFPHPEVAGVVVAVAAAVVEVNAFNLSPLLKSPSPLGVSQHGHLSISLGFFAEHVLHFHSPGLAANKSPHPEAAGTLALVLSRWDGAFSLELEEESFCNAFIADLDGVLISRVAGLEEDDSVLFWNLNAEGVETFDEALAPPGMKLKGAADLDELDALRDEEGAANVDGAVEVWAFFGWGVAVAFALFFDGVPQLAKPKSTSFDFFLNSGVFVSANNASPSSLEIVSDTLFKGRMSPRAGVVGMV